MIKVNLGTLPFLSLDYSNVIDFQDYNTREEYFNKQILKTIDANLKHDGERVSLIVNEKVEDCKHYDYLWFKNPSTRNWYYFITNIEQVTINQTLLHLKLDIWTTYLFSYSLMPSFVDRCHVPRWTSDNTPTYNMEDEGVEIGEYLMQEMEEICSMEDSIVVCASVPIGRVYNPNSSGGTGGDGTSWENGKLSSAGFRFIKGFEGFAESKYQDSGGYWTIAYGVTAHGEPDIYNELVSESPITEERGARVSYDLKNSNYGAKILQSVINLGCNTQYQFDALCSVAYNCGNGAVTGSNTLTNAIVLDPTNENVIRPIWENFKITSNGQTLPGLIARRKEECNMFFNKEYEVRSIATINSNGNISGTVTENNGNGWLPNDDSVGETNGYKMFTNEFGRYMCPVKGGTVSSKYGWRTHPVTGERKFHHGTDIGIAQGTTTVACCNGTITDCGFSSSMGYYIYLDNGDYRVKYMHLYKLNVSKGDTVSQGQKVGEIGSTGISTGPHAHWEIRRISDNESTDPAPSLQKGDKV